MRIFNRPSLPLSPLLRTYGEASVPTWEELTRLPDWGPRFQAIQAARAGLLAESFLDGATQAELQGAAKAAMAAWPNADRP